MLCEGEKASTCTKSTTNSIESIPALLSTRRSPIPAPADFVSAQERTATSLCARLRNAGMPLPDSGIDKTDLVSYQVSQANLETSGTRVRPATQHYRTKVVNYIFCLFAFHVITAVVFECLLLLDVVWHVVERSLHGPPTRRVLKSCPHRSNVGLKVVHKR